MPLDVFHEGELAVQRRAGLLDQGAHVSRAVRASIPGVARDFLARQPMAVLGAADEEGRLWASLLSGNPGFLRAESDTELAVAALPVPADPLYARLGGGPAPVGMIAIEPATRRRMRLNGYGTPSGDGFHVALDQVYANCPKYIRRREPHRAPGASGSPVVRTRDTRLPDHLRAFLADADTFFVATTDRDGHTDAAHRGGDPGFVQVLSPTALRWPDYTGNAMFNTLGNLEVDARAGLLFPDWRTGATVQITGTARTDWDPAAAAAVPGARRIVEFTVTGVVEIAGATPLRWSAPEDPRTRPPVAPPS